MAIHCIIYHDIVNKACHDIWHNRNLYCPALCTLLCYYTIFVLCHYVYALLCGGRLCCTSIGLVEGLPHTSILLTLNNCNFRFIYACYGHDIWSAGSANIVNSWKKFQLHMLFYGLPSSWNWMWVEDPNHNGSYGLPSTCNRKSYKTPFRISGRNCLNWNCEKYNTFIYNSTYWNKTTMQHQYNTALFILYSLLLANY